MKYRVALDDGTIVAETMEGVEFYVKDGNTFRIIIVCQFMVIGINLLVSFRSSLSSIAKSNNDHEKGREGQISCSTSVYVFVPCY